MRILIKFLSIVRAFLGQIFLTFVFVFSCALFFLLYPLVNDPDFYKNKILEELEKQSGLTFNFQNYEPHFFPFPGISFTKVSVQKSKNEVLFIQKAYVDIYYNVLFGEPLEIRKVILHTGELEFTRNKDESFDFSQIPSNSIKPIPSAKTVPAPVNDSEFGDLYFSQIFGLTPSRIEIKNFTIRWKDDLYSRNVDLYLHELNCDIEEKERKIAIMLFGKANGEPIRLNSEFQFTEDLITYESLHFDGDLTLTNFDGYLLQDILVIFKGTDFRKGKISGFIPFGKRDEDSFFIDIRKINIKNVAFQGQAPFADVNISTRIYYSLKQSKLGFDEIRASWDGVTKLYGSGYVTFTEKPIIYFEARADYMDVDSILNLTYLWIDVDLERSILVRNIPSTRYHQRMLVKLNFYISKAKYKNLEIDQADLEVNYRYHLVTMEKLDFKLFGGNLRARGNYTYGNPGKLLITGKLQGIDINDFLVNQYKEEVITGNIDGDFDLEVNGSKLEQFTQNLSLNTKLIARDGELLKYTNILKPVSSIGSLITLKGIDLNRSTPYKTLDLGVFYEKEVIKVSSFDLKANGFTIDGKGQIGLDKRIDMQFTIAMPGLAGKALKLPILYRGRYDKNNPFIDPIWLGSVYAGTLFLAGPAGTAVGGIAGSALSDYMNKAVDGVTDGVKKSWGRLFSSDKESKEKEN